MHFFAPDGSYPNSVVDDEVRIEAQLGTILGEQLLHPSYGFDLSQFIDRIPDLDVLVHIQRYIEGGFIDLDNPIEIKVVDDGKGLLEITYTRGSE